MKILILGFTKLKYLPYMHLYSDLIDKCKNEVHLIYWDRDDEKDANIPDSIIPHCFKLNMADSISLLKKLPNVYRYRKFAKKKINEINPDFLVVLHSTTALAIYDVLKKEYHNKYIFDFRDITYEKFAFYKKIVGNIVQNSTVTFTSSAGFHKYLPDIPNKIFDSHNILSDTLLNHDIYSKREKVDASKIVRISFWGMIRHKDINEIVICKLGNDKRFELHYYGRVSADILDLMNKSVEKYNNVFYHGEYLPADRNEFAKNTDIIHNLYSTSDATAPHAMGNKFYDGLIYYIPQLCTKGSFMGEMCENFKVGLPCDVYSDAFVDDIYNYYQTLNFESFKEDCDVLLNKIVSQVDYNNGIISSILNS